MDDDVLRQLIHRYEGGVSCRTLAIEFPGVGCYRTIANRLKKAGVVLRKGRLPRSPCRRCGSPVRDARAVYCSLTCWRAGGSKYPRPEPRPCEQCGTSFTPSASKVARGAGRFCRYACWNNWRTGKPQPQWRRTTA